MALHLHGKVRESVHRQTFAMSRSCASGHTSITRLRVGAGVLRASRIDNDFVLLTLKVVLTEDDTTELAFVDQVKVFSASARLEQELL